MAIKNVGKKTINRVHIAHANSFFSQLEILFWNNQARAMGDYRRGIPYPSKTLALRINKLYFYVSIKGYNIDAS